MVAAIGAVAGVAGAAISAGAVGDAADAQAASSREASQAQAMAAAQMRQDLSPWVGTGVAANNRLSQYLGLGLAPGAIMSNGMQAGLTRDQVRNQLLSQYTRTTSIPGQQPASVWGPNANQNNMIGMTTTYGNNTDGGETFETFNSNNPSTYAGTEPGMPQGTGPTSQSTVDEAALNAAIDRYYADQAAEEARLASDPNYGSLLRAYRNGAEFDSGPAFSFTGQDLQNDPGYQFGLNQGTQGIERGQASRGNFLSGAAMKELTRFNEDYAGTKFNDAFNRASSTYNTNLTRRQNEWNTNLNAYNQNRNTIYNFLTGQSTMGQNSAAQVGTNNQQTANAIGNNMMAAGNAQAAGAVAGANALSSGINTAVNGYNSFQNPNSAAGWNSLLNSNGGGYSGYTGYVGGSDPIANLNASKGWT